MFPKSLPVLNSKCANRASCTVLATTSMFGDPCPGTHKYLEAHYQCVSVAQTLTTTNRPSPPVVHSNNVPALPPLLANGSTIINGAHIPPPPRMPPPFIALTPSSSSTGPPTMPQPTGTRLRTTPSSSTDASKTVGSPSGPAHSPPPVVHHHGHGGNSVIRPPIPASGLGGEHIVLGAPKPTVGASSASPPATSTITAHKAASMPTVHSSSPPNTRILSGVGGVPGLDERATQQLQTQHQQKTNLASVGGATHVAGGVRTTVNNINTANISEAEANMLCEAMTVRNLYWNTTRVGDVNVQPCPAGSTGIAKWRCVLMKRLNDVDADLMPPTTTTSTTMRSVDCVNGTCESPMVMANKMNEQRNFEPTWHPLTPDLTQCRSLWLNNLEMRVNQPDSSLISIANDLSEVTSSKILYGGDMLVTTKIIQTMSEKMYHDKETFPDQRQREAIIMELLHGVVKTGSNLLDESQLSSWQDLNQEDQMRVATSLLTGLEYNAFLLADTIIRERNVVQKVKNILLSVRVLETKNIQSNEVFPEPDQWHISDDRIELPRVSLIENSEGGLVRIVFAAFDRLESILKPSYDHFDLKSARTYVKTTANVNNDTDPDSSGASQRLRILNSKVISASLGKGRHIQLSQPIKLVLKHIKTENVTNPTCVFWNYIDHSWSANGCSLESTNRTHSICMCNHLTNFAILMDVMDEHTHSLFTMFDGNMRILIYISVLVCVIFILIALLTLKIFNGVFIKTTRTLIYRNIYVCLLCNEIIFLIGIELSDTNMLCGFTTMFTHLFVFATMAWFCFEAFQSYTILTTDDMILEDQNCKVNCYYLISYGLSISTVALALFIKASSYTACDFCVLMAEDNLFYFSFLAPVAMFLLGAIVYIFLSWLIMCRKSRTTLKNKEHTRLANVRFDIRCSFIFLVLLVAVWISGYFYLRLAKLDDDRAVVCGYLFVGFNTVMGFYIFVFHCIQNEKIRREYRKYVRQNAWLPKCLRCSKTSISSGMGCGSGVSGGAAANANSGGTLASGTLSGNATLGAAGQMKHKVPIESALDNEEAGIMTEDAIVATSDCELNESVGAQSIQTRRTAGGTLKSMTKPLGSAGILAGSLVKGDPKLAGPGATGTIRSTGGGGGLQTPSIGHTSPTSSVGSTQLIFGHGHKHHAGGQVAPGGGVAAGGVNMNANNAEAYYYHPDYYSWTAGRQHQTPGPPGLPGGLSPQHHHMQQQQPHEIFYWTQKHNANSKKKKRGSSATTGPDSPSGSLHSRTTAAASQQVLFYPSYKKTAGPPRGGHPQYAQYAEAIEPYYQQQQQPQYERRHHKPQGGPYLQQQQQQQQLSSDDEQIESAAHAHLLHLGRRGGSQLPPLPPAAMGQEFGGSQHRNYRNKHSCDLNPKYDESVGGGHRSNGGEQAYYNHGSMTSGGEGPVYEEILSNRSSDVQHYDVGDDDDDDVGVGRGGSMMMVAGMPGQRNAGGATAGRRHRSRRSHMHHQQAQPYRDDDDDDEDGDDDEGRDDDESLGEEEDGVYDPEGVMPQNTQERMHRLMAMQDEDFQRRFQRQQRKNAMNQDYQQQQQQRDFDLHPQQPGPGSSHPHYPESNAIFGVVSNANGGGGSVRSFKKTSPSHHARGGVLEHFTHGPPLPPGNQAQQMAQQQQQQHPVGRNISAMLDENNTVRCYLEPLNK